MVERQPGRRVHLRRSGHWSSYAGPMMREGRTTVHRHHPFYFLLPTRCFLLGRTVHCHLPAVGAVAEQLTHATDGTTACRIMKRRVPSPINCIEASIRVGHRLKKQFEG